MRAAGMRSLLLAVALLAGLSTACAAQAPDAPQLDAHMRAADAFARQWLERVDAGQWDDAWAAMAPMFRSQVPRQQWQTMVSEMHAAAGPPGARSVRAARTGHEVFGADAVTLEYVSSGGAANWADEQVVVYPEADGWRVGGYAAQARPRER